MHLYANVKLKYGKLLEFNETMAELVPIFERRGWKLVGAWSTVVGDINEVHDIWEIEDANAVPATLAEIATDPDFPEYAQALADQIERETLTLITKTPYSP